MKYSVFVFTICLGIASAQFLGFGGGGGGGGGGFGGGFGGALSGGLQNLASGVQQGISSLASSIPSPPALNNVQDFGDFVSQAGKTYASAAEQLQRENIFTEGKNLVDAANAAFAQGASSFELALNAFADLTDLEFLTQLTGLKRSAAGDAKVAAHAQPPQVPDIPIPDSFDWRDENAVTPVNFQGTCGCCWAFAAIGAIESHAFRRTGQLQQLSQQNLLDCGPTEFALNGCNGGFQEYAFAFLSEKKEGISALSSYPYASKQDQCQHSSEPLAQLQGLAVIPPKNERLMKKAIATTGPIACSMSVIKSFRFYKKGIYNDEECNGQELNHSVLVVGYGTEDGQDYWIIRNSWDTVWGEEGYFRLPRGKNFCSIALECSYPIL